jgi:pyridinium-3,5-biscarboxylic acid mononucleotide synthase
VDETTIRQLLEAVRSGALHPDDAVSRLRTLPFTSAGDALVDHHRLLRQGMPEAVYGRGKSPEQCVAIVGELLVHGTGPVLVTRTDEAQVEALSAAHPGATAHGGCLLWRAPDPGSSDVLVISAGTADTPVVDECLVTLAAYGIAGRRIVDVGVAGLHRLLAHLDDVLAADAIIVVAGMEGALASVIGGLTGAPVVAVPTSVGYGAGLDGVTALLAMHATCAAGITVVGIDNGYGAACAMARLVRGPRS